MSNHTAWTNRVIVAAVALNIIGGAHLIDDFVYGVTDDFGISIAAGEVLALVWYAILAVLLVLTARGRRAGIIGHLAIGLFLFAADMLKHVPEMATEWPYRGNWLSTILASALVISSFTLALVSFLALRHIKTTGQNHHV